MKEEEEEEEDMEYVLVCVPVLHASRFALSPEYHVPSGPWTCPGPWEQRMGYDGCCSCCCVVVLEVVVGVVMAGRYPWTWHHLRRPQKKLLGLETATATAISALVVVRVVLLLRHLLTTGPRKRSWPASLMMAS